MLSRSRGPKTSLAKFAAFAAACPTSEGPPSPGLFVASGAGTDLADQMIAGLLRTQNRASSRLDGEHPRRTTLEAFFVHVAAAIAGASAMCSRMRGGLFSPASRCPAQTSTYGLAHEPPRLTIPPSANAGVHRSARTSVGPLIAVPGKNSPAAGSSAVALGPPAAPVSKPRPAACSDETL